MAAPIGNQNARKAKEWFDALRKEAIQKGTLAKVAKLVCEKAEIGEVWAIQELANRFDGKPAQAVEVSGADGGPVETVTRYTLADLE
jgi:hypothetical protein